jgi:hypothetical protein
VHGVEADWFVMGIEADVLVLVPEVGVSCQQVFDLKRLCGIETPVRQRKMEPGLVGVEGIEIDDDQHPV